MDKLQELSEDFKKLQKRIERIEERLFGSVIPQIQLPETDKSINPEISPINRLNPQEVPHTKSQKDDGLSGTSRLLGVIAIICFVLAAGFLIKLAIDSGWLNPARQILGAALFGLSLVGIGLGFRKRDTSYLSLLPAGGIIILYLTVATGNRLYDLYSPTMTVALMSWVSVLSIYLLVKLRTETYVGVSIIGTYGSVFLLPDQLDPTLLTTYFLIWDITFAILPVLLKSRIMLLVASYLSLGIFQWVIELPWLSPDPNIYFVIGAQALQFLIFLVSLIFYSIRNKTLTQTESWAFFPILIFFYGIEYSLLHRVYPEYTPWVATAFGAMIYFLYEITKTKLKTGTLNSSVMIHTFLSVILFHALYLEILPPSLQIWSGPTLLILLFGILERFSKRSWPLMFLITLIAMISYVRSLWGDTAVGWSQIITMNLLFGTLFLVGYARLIGKLGQANGEEVDWESCATICLGFAHLQLLVGIYRLIDPLAFQLHLSSELKPFLASSTWGALGIGILLRARSRRDVILARSALLILVVACGKLFLFDVSISAPIIRILCFLITGIVLYLAGYLLRKVNDWSISNKQNP